MTEFKHINRRQVLAGAAGLGAASLLPGAALAADYPSRPITLIIPWSAGGGTDATGRAIAAVLQEELGQPVNVVNRTGGQGVVGHAAIAAAKPDGYTLGIITVEINMLHWLGLTDLTGAAPTRRSASTIRTRPACRCAPTRLTRRPPT